MFLLEDWGEIPSKMTVLTEGSLMYQRVEQAEPQVLEHNHGLMVAKEMQKRFPNREDGTQGYYEWDIVVYIDLTVYEAHMIGTVSNHDQAVGVGYNDLAKLQMTRHYFLLCKSTHSKMLKEQLTMLFQLDTESKVSFFDGLIYLLIFVFFSGRDFSDTSKPPTTLKKFTKKSRLTSSKLIRKTPSSRLTVLRPPTTVLSLSHLYNHCRTPKRLSKWTSCWQTSV